MNIASPTKRRGATRSHQYAIGDVGVSLRSTSPEALEDFNAVYGAFRRDTAVGGSLIHVDVRPSAGWRVRRRFDIVAAGETQAAGRRVDEVLPHVEWSINQQVIETRSEYVQIHAASLVRNGQGVIIAGPSGAGKSTLAAGLCARGWQYLSDEFALVHARTGLLHPFPRALSVKAGSFEIVRALGMPLFRKRPYVRALKGPLAYIRPEDLGGGASVTPVPPRVVILPRYTGHEDVRTQTVPRARAAFRLAGQMLNRDRYDARAIPIIARIVRGATCYAMECGELARACDRIEALLDGEASAVRQEGACGGRTSCACGGQCRCKRMSRGAACA